MYANEFRAHHHEHGHHGHGPGPGEWGPWGHVDALRRHLGGRARRGDVQPAVLALLAEKDMHGYQIIQELSARSGGAWSPSPGSIYPTLQMLEDRGLVVSRQEEGKRVFSLTEEGRTRASELPEQAPWAEMGEGAGAPAWRLREAMGALGKAVVIGFRTTTPERQERIVDVLNEARKRVYEILAESE